MNNKSQFAVCFYLLLLLAVLSGCNKKVDSWAVDSNYVCVQIDPNSSRAFMTAILPEFEIMNKQMMELVSQNRWYRERLDKCLGVIEAEKGLEPMPFDPYPWPIKGDSNLANEPKEEPLYLPYKSLSATPLSDPNNIYVFNSLLNLQMLSVNFLMPDSDARIKNFELRLKRLDENLNK